MRMEYAGIDGQQQPPQMAPRGPHKTVEFPTKRGRRGEFVALATQEARGDGDDIGGPTGFAQIRIAVAAEGQIVAVSACHTMQHIKTRPHLGQDHIATLHLVGTDRREHCLVAIVFEKGTHTPPTHSERHRMAFVDGRLDGWYECFVGYGERFH